MKTIKNIKIKKYFAAILIIAAALVFGYANRESAASVNTTTQSMEAESVNGESKNAGIVPAQGFVSIKDIQAYSGKPYVVLNGNVPLFTREDSFEKSFEHYSDLDRLGRCGVAYANIGRDLMPAEKRGKIGQIKPSGWHSVKYDCVDGKYLYNRCHLIAYELTAENANEKNLITGTRYFNLEGMLPFENMVADYVKETGNHVLYRVTPLYQGNNLVADGVRMEAKSVEDNGDGILYHVFVYNVQPGVSINYATGDSCLADSDSKLKGGMKQDYILNTKSKKFHDPSCSSVPKIKEKNKKKYQGSHNLNFHKCNFIPYILSVFKKWCTTPGGGLAFCGSYCGNSGIIIL